MADEELKQDRLPGIRFGGPYLGAAILCEKVLQEKDDVLTVVRMVDRITVAVRGEAPTQIPPGSITLVLFVLFKSGEARGTYQVGIRTVNPSGQVLSTSSFPILLEGDDRGAALVNQVTVEVQEDGVYWFEILLEDQLVTRVPLRVIYQRFLLSQRPGGG